MPVEQHKSGDWFFEKAEPGKFGVYYTQILGDEHEFSCEGPTLAQARERIRQGDFSNMPLRLIHDKQLGKFGTITNATIRDGWILAHGKFDDTVAGKACYEAAKEMYDRGEKISVSMGMSYTDLSGSLGRNTHGGGGQRSKKDIIAMDKRFEECSIVINGYEKNARFYRLHQNPPMSTQDDTQSSTAPSGKPSNQTPVPKEGFAPRDSNAQEGGSGTEVSDYLKKYLGAKYETDTAVRASLESLFTVARGVYGTKKGGLKIEDMEAIAKLAGVDPATLQPKDMQLALLQAKTAYEEERISNGHRRGETEQELEESRAKIRRLEMVESRFKREQEEKSAEYLAFLANNKVGKFDPSNEKVKNYIDALHQDPTHEITITLLNDLRTLATSKDATISAQEAKIVDLQENLARYTGRYGNSAAKKTEPAAKSASSSSSSSGANKAPTLLDALSALSSDFKGNGTSNAPRPSYTMPQPCGAEERGTKRELEQHQPQPRAVEQHSTAAQGGATRDTFADAPGFKEYAAQYRETAYGNAPDPRNDAFAAAAFKYWQGKSLDPKK